MESPKVRRGFPRFKRLRDPQKQGGSQKAGNLDPVTLTAPNRTYMGVSENQSLSIDPKV